MNFSDFINQANFASVHSYIGTNINVYIYVVCTNALFTYFTLESWVGSDCTNEWKTLLSESYSGKLNLQQYLQLLMLDFQLVNKFPGAAVDFYLREHLLVEILVIPGVCDSYTSY